MWDSEAVATANETTIDLAKKMAELARQLAMPLSLPDVLAGVTKSVLEITWRRMSRDFAVHQG
jgi:hypothetical protein